MVATAGRFNNGRRFIRETFSNTADNRPVNTPQLAMSRSDADASSKGEGQSNGIDKSMVENKSLPTLSSPAGFKDSGLPDGQSTFPTLPSVTNSSDSIDFSAKSSEPTEEITLLDTDELTPNNWGPGINAVMANEDRAALRDSIAKSGIKTPLVVWSAKDERIVICGSNRLAIAKELGIKEVPVIIRDYPDEHAAKLAAIDDNLARRQLTTVQRAALALEYQELLQVGSGKRTDLEPLSKMSKVNARKEAAKKAGVSEGTMVNLKIVKRSGSKKLIDMVAAGHITVSKAAGQLRQKRRAKTDSAAKAGSTPASGLSVNPDADDSQRALLTALDDFLELAASLDRMQPIILKRLEADDLHLVEEPAEELFDMMEAVLKTPYASNKVKTTIKQVTYRLQTFAITS